MNILKKSIQFIKREGFFVFLKVVFDRIYYLLARMIIAPYWARKIKKINFENRKELLNFAFRKMPKFFRPSQIEEEISLLVEILWDRKPKTILEIGTAGGGTLFLFCKIADSTAKIISIDLPWGKFGRGYPKWETLFYRSFKNNNQRLFFLRKNSHQEETLEALKYILNGEGIDFLFIDGDHSYEGVKKDFEMYAPLVKKGGIIALHDIVEHPKETGCGAAKFWREIKKDYKKREIIKEEDQKWAGIGVIYK